MTNQKLYPEEPDARQEARLALQRRIRELDELWPRRANGEVSDDQLQSAITAVNEAGVEYAATF